MITAETAEAELSLIDSSLFCVYLTEKTPEQQAEEDELFQQIIEVVEMRNSLVTFLEEKRLKEISEKEEAFSIMEAKRHSKAGSQVQWA